MYKCYEQVIVGCWSFCLVDADNLVLLDSLDALHLGQGGHPPSQAVGRAQRARILGRRGEEVGFENLPHA